MVGSTYISLFETKYLFLSGPCLYSLLLCPVHVSLQRSAGGMALLPSQLNLEAQMEHPRNWPESDSECHFIISAQRRYR